MSSFPKSNLISIIITSIILMYIYGRIRNAQDGISLKKMPPGQIITMSDSNQLHVFCFGPQHSDREIFYVPGAGEFFFFFFNVIEIFLVFFVHFIFLKQKKNFKINLQIQFLI